MTIIWGGGLILVITLMRRPGRQANAAAPGASDLKAFIGNSRVFYDASALDRVLGARCEPSSSSYRASG